MCNQTCGAVALPGRVAICAIFLTSALANKIPHFSQVVEVMRAKAIPFPRLALIVAIAILLLGSVSVIVGFKARWGAFLLLAFLFAATFYFHDFWNIEGEGARVQQIMFMKNVSIAGTMLLIIAAGAGPWSLDACRVSEKACDTVAGLGSED